MAVQFLQASHPDVHSSSACVSTNKSVARHIEEEILKDITNRPEMSDWFTREELAPAVLVKRPNPRNAQMATRMQELEAEIQRHFLFHQKLAMLRLTVQQITRRARFVGSIARNFDRPFITRKHGVSISKHPKHFNRWRTKTETSTATGRGTNTVAIARFGSSRALSSVYIRLAQPTNIDHIKFWICSINLNTHHLFSLEARTCNRPLRRRRAQSHPVPHRS